MTQQVYKLQAKWPDGRIAWYERRGWPPHWGDHDTASIWPSKHGPRSTIGQLKGYYRRHAKHSELIPELEIVSFVLTEINE